jgi:hypothetical protein
VSIIEILITDGMGNDEWKDIDADKITGKELLDKLEL